jgi:methionyl-tRNA formyltransferase
MALRVVFFGTPEFAATVLRALADSPHEVAAAVAAPDRPSGRGRKVKAGAVSALARERGIPLFQPESLRDAATLERLRSFEADVFAVASYGLIFPEPALAIPRHGALNAHASLLPLLRGAAPVERAILAGLAETGVSIQRMVRRVDAGDVYAARPVPVGPRETARALHERLADVAAEMLPQVMMDIEAGTARAEPQEESAVTLAPPLEPHERAIRWSEGTSMIDRRVRAFAPKPGAFALLPDELGSKRIKMLEAEPAADPAVGKGAPGEALVASDREGLVVAAAEGALRLVTVQPEGKRAMDAKAFLRGHKVARGMRFADGLPEK